MNSNINLTTIKNWSWVTGRGTHVIVCFNVWDGAKFEEVLSCLTHNYVFHLYLLQQLNDNQWFPISSCLFLLVCPL